MQYSIPSTIPAQRAILGNLKYINRQLRQRRSYVVSDAGKALCLAAANYSSLLAKLRLIERCNQDRPFAG